MQAVLEAMDPKEFLKQVAEKAARNTQSSIAEVFRREKSQNYLFGRLKKEFPEHDGDELRELVTSVRWETAEDPAAQEVFTRPRRPPARGREPLESEKWDERLQKLRSVMADDPLTTDEVLMRAQRELGWKLNFFISVLAAADNRGALVYRHPFWRTATDKLQTRSISARRIARAQIRALRRRNKDG